MYGIIVCTKCRLHAQIIEVGTSRTVQCQRCGARLDVRKLQLMSTSEDRDEVVAARTLIQTKIRSNGSVHSIQAQSFQCNSSHLNNSNAGMHFSALANSRNICSRDPVTIILQSISIQGETIEELEDKCALLGIDRDVFKKMLHILTDSGHIYSPAKGKVKKV